ncbi:alpha-D-ribose 1-methylphosphonate 5-triphosphate diphosphatase [Natronomonas halophila]|uniref:alpha-D-ribose 1-methylphosphonate 5-triphosphate diphosphatase n=1 Tax=Natronomonas halophila TaxID=2747817 RepID=UPI0015B4E8C2|nr:alpha-D-ribose 1-methylphosphonate 5-triphosphate diphosphatase [Natronomonas halophila]QLD87108.1 alpha-D-ribose 1-methylphosphonate 5-triphosphate diphosphatase [Natronomonas halophila]
MNRDSNTTQNRDRRYGTAGVTPAVKEESTRIAGGRIVTPDGVYEDGSLLISGSRIERVNQSHDRRTHAHTTVDATDRVVMPGLVDLHGDDIESHLFPRPEARIDTDRAVVDADRANVTSGITTKFHAIAFEDDPDENRTVSLARELVETFEASPELLGDNRVHARCEVTESVDAVRELLSENTAIDLVSLMNHVPGDGQFADREAFERRYVEGHRLSPDGAERLAERRADTDESTLRDRIATLSDHASDAGLPVASHDDTAPETVERMAALDVSISEFPVTLAAAERASELGLHTVMGAPNLVQGGSLWGNLAVEDAVDAGVVDVLCSDYHPPSLLAAPFVPTGEPLHERVARVTSNPADAVGLDDRGRIEAGRRADVLVVDPEPVPTVERAFVNGEAVLQASETTRDRARTEYSPAS